MTGRDFARRVLRLLRPHVAALAGAAALAAVLSATRGALVLLARELIDALSRPDPVRAVLLPAAALLVVTGLGGAARVGRLQLTRGAGLRAEADLRARLFEVLLGRDPSALHRDGLGDSLARLSHDAGKIRTAVGALVTGVQRPLSALAIAGAAFATAPRLAPLGLLALPAVAGVIGWAGGKTRRAARRQQDALARLESTAQDALRGLRTVQAHGHEGAARERFAAAAASQVGAAERRILVQALGPAGVELVAAVLVAGLVLLAAFEVAGGRLSAGALVAFLLAIGLLGEPLKGIAVAHGLWEEARGGLARVFEILDRPAPRPERADARPLRASRVEIRLQAVTVDRGRGPVLRDLDLLLRPGELVAVSGPSGAGKSTLIDLLAGFAEPCAGTVSWNGEPAEGLTLASRRAHTALVDQDPWLGSGTLADAVALGRPGADDAEVRAALELAELTQDGLLLRSLAEGTSARVGDGGTLLSGGERRRVALARAILRDAPLLLLDEPTAGLDPEAAGAVLRTVLRLRGGRTILLVGHDRDAAAHADRRYRLEDGRLLPEAAPRAREALA